MTTPGPRPRSRALPVLSLAILLIVGGLLALRLLSGRVAEVAAVGGGPEWLRTWLASTGADFSEDMKAELDDVLGVGAACVGAVWALVVLVSLARRLRPRLLTVAAALVVWWIGVETLASPLLARRLGLQPFLFVADVDHVPELGRRGNRDNLRGTREPEQFTSEGLNILFLGDSFTEGHRVPARDAFVGRVERQLASAYPDTAVRCANFAWGSSSPLLSLRRLVDLGEKYDPDVVCLCVDMSDFQDDLRYARMLDRRGIYRAYPRIPISLLLLRRFVPTVFDRWHESTTEGMPARRFFATEMPLEESRPYLASTVRHLSDVSAWCRERGALFVVFVLPRSYQYSDRESPNNWEAEQYTVLGPNCLAPFEFFEDLADDVDYPIHALLADFLETETFPTCFGDDPRWNVAGHAVAGAAIARELKVEIDRVGVLEER